ncbi:hypothetical protein FDT66_04405 [Polaribacter aestuariivivens]|uniref:DUF5723 domain-containing protein n=1 Tax=Polaribacter aestuariivivens TaxID=2304626 RepID=A0A5S3N7V3_9FLAO|nr:hypothetical protein [Polaribacter aestuariivivens]TMM31217.1 hypothetical protein FDT66_04405 [Polaribacter aestuariivivens]
MKKKFFTLTVLFFTFSSFAQEVPYQLYQKDLRATDTKDTLFNNKMLNLFFANEVGTAFAGSNDLSLQKFYASIDASDKSLSIGFNYDSRPNDKLKRLKYIHSGNFKLKSSDKFATVFDFSKDNPFQKDNIGFSYKFSIIGRGILNFTSTGKVDRKAAIISNRKKLYKEYNTVVDNAQELYVEMVEKEITFIKANKLYKHQWNHWYSAEIYLPFGKRTFLTTPNITTAYKEHRFWEASLGFSANTMWEFSKGYAIFLKGLFTLKNNNNILVDNLSSNVFQTEQTGFNNTTVITNTENVYITDYDPFVTSSILLEPAFFIKTGIGSFGFSPSVEFNFGTYNGTNLKIGVPISLYDGEGKPKVNFELQWKKVETLSSNIELIGLSTSFLFGDLIN